VYIDLNLVHAGMIDRRAQWRICGFNEIQSSRIRYRIIEMDALCELTGSSSADAPRLACRAWVEQELTRAKSVRQSE
jgi:hypothetical protein